MSRLKALRKAMEMSQAEMAKKLGITQQAYANYENGKRDANTDMLRKMSEIFSCSIDYILGNSDVLSGGYELPPIYTRIARYAEENGIDPADILKITKVLKKVNVDEISGDEI